MVQLVTAAVSVELCKGLQMLHSLYKLLPCHLTEDPSHAVGPEASPGQNGRAADAVDGDLFGEYAHVLDAKDLQVPGLWVVMSPISCCLIPLAEELKCLMCAVHMLVHVLSQLSPCFAAIALAAVRTGFCQQALVRPDVPPARPLNPKRCRRWRRTTS